MTGSKTERRSLPMAFPRVFSLPPAVIGIGYLASYVLLDWVSFIQPFAPFGITPWNPPTGLSFILVLLFGQRYLPLLFAAPSLMLYRRTKSFSIAVKSSEALPTFSRSSQSASSFLY
jgi:hypothetical protein